MNDVLTIVLGGGRGTRLFPLTHLRSKPAVPIGGKYRLIDIPISNCLNSNLRRIFPLRSCSDPVFRDYARRGRPFKSPIIREHFERMVWYKADPAFTESRLTAVRIPSRS